MQHACTVLGRNLERIVAVTRLDNDCSINVLCSFLPKLLSVLCSRAGHASSSAA
jgi:hypothetical protein